MKHTILNPLLATLVLLLSCVAMASPEPAGLEAWGDEDYRLEPGESTSFLVEFEDIPVRRWVLLVESDGGISHLNVRRVVDGSLLFDARDERRHEVEVPWGVDEELSAVITAGDRGGVYRVSIWGPPRQDYRRSYGYEVNRALEAMEREDMALADHHLQAAQRKDPDDPVAALLAAALARGIVPTDPATSVGGEPAGDSPEMVRLAREAMDRATAFRLEKRHFEALDQLQAAMGMVNGGDLRLEILVDLVAVHLAIGNVEQALSALKWARELGLDQARSEELQGMIDGAQE